MMMGVIQVGGFGARQMLKERKVKKGGRVDVRVPVGIGSDGSVFFALSAPLTSRMGMNGYTVNKRPLLLSQAFRYGNELKLKVDALDNDEENDSEEAGSVIRRRLVFTLYDLKDLGDAVKRAGGDWVLVPQDSLREYMNNEIDNGSLFVVCMECLGCV